MKPTDRIAGNNIKLRKPLEVPSKALQPGEMRVQELAAKLNEYFQQRGVAPGRSITQESLYCRLKYNADLRSFVRRTVLSFGRNVSIFHIDDLPKIAGIFEAPSTFRQTLQEGEITPNQLTASIIDYARENKITLARSTKECALHTRLRQTKELEPYVIRRVALHGFNMPVFKMDDVPKIVKLFEAPATLKQAIQEGEITLNELGGKIVEYASKHELSVTRRTTPAAIHQRMNKTEELRPFIRRKVKICGYDMPLFHIDDLPEIAKMFTKIGGDARRDKKIEMKPTGRAEIGRIKAFKSPAQPREAVRESKMTIHQLAERIAENAKERGVALPLSVADLYKMIIFTEGLEQYFKRILKTPDTETPLFNEADLKEIINLLAKEQKG